MLLDNSKKTRKQFLFFLLMGGVAAGVNFLSRMVFGLYLSYEWSIIFAYLAGMLTGYFLFKYIVFDSKRNTTSEQIFYFILVNVVSALLTLIVSVVLMNYVFTFITDQFQREEAAHFFGICAPLLISFLGHKKWSFR